MPPPRSRRHAPHSLAVNLRPPHELPQRIAGAKVYRADTYQLIRAGLTGGKGVPTEVAQHPCVFVTLTAPSFGAVHARLVRGDRVLACRPRRNGRTCPHGVRLPCNEKHARDDDRLGEPLCPDCYDCTGSVLFNAYAPELWRRFTITLRRALARRAGLTSKEFAAQTRLSYAKVAEYQRRGVVHFHAIVRLDGLAGPVGTPPAWATLGLLTDAIGQAARAVRLQTPVAPHRRRHHARDSGLALHRSRRPAIRRRPARRGRRLRASLAAGRCAMRRLLLTVLEAAEALAISRSKLYELLASGDVASIRIDGARRIPLTALEEYVSRLLAERTAA
jgi:excisionase family DNA binding protein